MSGQRSAVHDRANGASLVLRDIRRDVAAADAARCLLGSRASPQLRGHGLTYHATMSSNHNSAGTCSDSPGGLKPYGCQIMAWGAVIVVLTAERQRATLQNFCGTYSAAYKCHLLTSRPAALYLRAIDCPEVVLNA